MNNRYLKHIPNFLTIIRLILTPLCIYALIEKDWRYIALSIFIIASITDFLDGYFARKYNAVSKIGSFLDPLADKFLVLSTFFSFVFLGDVHLWMVVLISFRDIFVTILRMIMEAKGITMITTKVGKLKTLLQMVIINVVFLYLLLKAYGFTQYSEYFDKYQIIYSLMLITTMVTVYTGLHYFYFNHKKLKMILFNK